MLTDLDDSIKTNTSKAYIIKIKTKSILFDMYCVKKCGQFCYYEIFLMIQKY